MALKGSQTTCCLNFRSQISLCFLLSRYSAIQVDHEMTVESVKVLSKSVLLFILLNGFSSGEGSFYYLAIWDRMINVKKKKKALEISTFAEQFKRIIVNFACSLKLFAFSPGEVYIFISTHPIVN